MRLRAGKGFTPAEVKAAGWTVREARQFGVAVDMKRRNRSVEGLQTNVQRIKEYRSKVKHSHAAILVVTDFGLENFIMAAI